jgi:spermidine/putrescine transport system ATP-binding protein
MLAGFIHPDVGEIWVDGKNLTHVPPEKRPINTVFQNYALFPHLTIRDNIAFGLSVARRPKAEIRVEVDRMLHLIQMQEHADKRPHQISGGQKQRVAIARALINKPQLLLLDEPLAALDLKLRQRMLLELDRIHDEVGITFLYVTHDQSEAMSLSDRIAVMHEGKIEQLGTPAEIYETPRTRFVAGFIGDANIFTGSVSNGTTEDYLTIEVAGLSERVYRLTAWRDQALAYGESAHLSVRPEKIVVSREEPVAEPKRNRLQGIIEDKIYLGSQTRFRVRVGEHLVFVQQQHGRFLLDTKPLTWNEPVWLSWHADDGQLVVDASL